MSLATTPGAAHPARAKEGHGPGRLRSLNAPDSAGDFNRPWRPLSRQRIEISGLDLMEPREAEASGEDPAASARL